MSKKRDRKVERTREALAAKDEEAGAKDEEAGAKDEEQQIAGVDRTPDDQDPRAKSTGHGKKTADK